MHTYDKVSVTSVFSCLRFAKKCDTPQITTFWRALTYCTHDSYQEITSTTSSELLGNIFNLNNQNDPIEKFTSIEQLLNASKIDISDIIQWFEFHVWFASRNQQE